MMSRQHDNDNEVDESDNNEGPRDFDGSNNGEGDQDLVRSPLPTQPSTSASLSPPHDDHACLSDTATNAIVGECSNDSNSEERAHEYKTDTIEGQPLSPHSAKTGISLPSEVEAEMESASTSVTDDDRRFQKPERWRPRKSSDQPSSAVEQNEEEKTEKDGQESKVSDDGDDVGDGNEKIRASNNVGATAAGAVNVAAPSSHSNAMGLKPSRRGYNGKQQNALNPHERPKKSPPATTGAAAAASPGVESDVFRRHHDDSSLLSPANTVVIPSSSVLPAFSSTPQSATTSSSGAAAAAPKNNPRQQRSAHASSSYNQQVEKTRRCDAAAVSAATSLPTDNSAVRPGAVAVTRTGDEEARTTLVGNVDGNNEDTINDDIDNLYQEERHQDQQQLGLEEAGDVEDGLLPTTATSMSPSPSDTQQTQQGAIANVDQTSSRRGSDISNSVITSEHVVQADLVEVVPPTVHAVTVFIDEEGGDDHDHHRTSTSSSSSPTGESDISNGSPKDPSSQYCPRWCEKWQYRAILWASIAALLLLLLLLLIDPEKDDDYDNDRGNSQSTQGQQGGPTRPQSPDDSLTQPTSSPTAKDFGYECYHSTRELFLAQVYDFVESDFESTADTYIICPGSRIEVGVLNNPSVGDLSFVDGDYPIAVLQPNTTIQCGIDGSLSNDCQLIGGFLQVSLLSYIESYFQMDASGQDSVNLEAARQILTRQEVVELSNVTIKGMSFTGRIDTVGSFAGNSVLISQPGHLTMEDCRWYQMTATTGVVAIFEVQELKAVDPRFAVDPLTSQLTLRRCQFDDIVYDNPIIMVTEQRLHVEDTVFTNLRPSAFSSLCPFEWLGQPEEFSAPTFVLERGCANILTCILRSQCSIHNSCVQNVESFSPALVFMAEPGSVVPEDQVLGIGFDATATINDAASITQMYNNYIDQFSRSSTNCSFMVSENIDGSGRNCLGDTAFSSTQCNAAASQ